MKLNGRKTPNLPKSGDAISVCVEKYRKEKGLPQNDFLESLGRLLCFFALLDWKLWRTLKKQKRHTSFEGQNFAPQKRCLRFVNL